MRTLLRSDQGIRKKFRAIFDRFGKKTNYHGYSDETILLVNIVDVETNAVVTDHAWFALTRSFGKLNLEPGMAITFEARIKSYKKGYVNRRYRIDNRAVDYKLSHPTRVSVVEP